MEEKENVEIFEDGTTIELFDDENNPVEFFEIASIELDGKFYELLQPVEPIDGIDEGEAVILEYESGGEEEERTFKPLFDEALLNRVFDEYLRAASELDDDCGCGCEDCDCDEDEESCDDEACECCHHHE